MDTLRRFLPVSVFGGVPGRQSKAIWYEVSQLLEASYIHSQSLQGLVLDIQRAFNCLPRIPVWNLLAVLGLPAHILRAWASFVSGQSRMFRIRASCSDPVKSCVGFPEGCALSVTAMVLIDWLLERWISVTCGEHVNLFAYIDDWHLTFANAVMFPSLWQSVLDFSGAVDLLVDSNKSFLWAAQSVERRLFKEAEFGVTLAARDLGVHHNFCKKAGNKTLTDRIRELDGMWTQLRASPSSYRLKLKVITQLAWPRSLFGLSVVHLGSSHYCKLRSGAMRGLSADRVGSNPILHLSSQNVLLDPECWGLLQTFRDVREVGNIPLMEFALTLLQAQPEVVPGNGPASILNSRVARLGWTLSNGGMVDDAIGSFNLFTVSWQALMHRVSLAWPRTIATEVSHRASFAGIQHADLLSTKQFLRKIGDADKVFALCALDGTLYTDVHKTKDNRGTHSRCRFCNSVDSFYHRLWQCEAFSCCRAGFKWTSLLPHLPSCLTCHGWAILPAAWVEYQAMLEQLPEPFFRVDWTHGPADCIDLFTDGSCLVPACPRLCVASWAVIHKLWVDHRLWIIALLLVVGSQALFKHHTGGNSERCFRPYEWLLMRTAKQGFGVTMMQWSRKLGGYCVGVLRNQMALMRIFCNPWRWSLKQLICGWEWRSSKWYLIVHRKLPRTTLMPGPFGITCWLTGQQANLIGVGQGVFGSNGKKPNLRYSFMRNFIGTLCRLFWRLVVMTRVRPLLH